MTIGKKKIYVIISEVRIVLCTQQNFTSFTYYLQLSQLAVVFLILFSNLLSYVVALQENKKPSPLFCNFDRELLTPRIEP